MGEEACGPVLGHLHPLLEPQPSDDGIEHQHLRGGGTVSGDSAASDLGCTITLRHISGATAVRNDWCLNNFVRNRRENVCFPFSTTP